MRKYTLTKFNGLNAEIDYYRNKEKELTEKINEINESDIEFKEIVFNQYNYFLEVVRTEKARALEKLGKKST